MQILAALDEVVRDHERLTGDDAGAGELGAVHLHQPRLAEGGEGLERGQIVGTASETERGHPGGHGARGDEEDFVAGVAEPGDLVTETSDD